MPYSNFAGLTPVLPPADRPVTVADVRAHSRIFTDLDDSLIGGLITAATMSCENAVKRAFMPQTWRLALEQWPGRLPTLGYREATSFNEYWKWNHIDLPLPPLRSIVSFTYMDTQGTVLSMTEGYGNTVGNYLLDLEAEPGRIYLPFSGIWPTTILLPGSPIKITFECGYPAFSGILQVDIEGVATSVAGDNFDPLIAGTWINVGGQQLTVVNIVGPNVIQLSASIDQFGANIPWSASAVPMPIRQAILYTVAHFYEIREPVITGRGETAIEIPKTADSLLADYRIYRS